MAAPTTKHHWPHRDEAYRRNVIEIVDRAPPLGQTQKARLAMLLREVARQRVADRG